MTYVLGVDICNKLIISIIDSKGIMINYSETPLPQPCMPGALTITLCEQINTINYHNHAKYIGICISGKVCNQGRIVQVCKAYPGWSQVPLADWLEVRLNKKVFLCSRKSCQKPGLLWNLQTKNQSSFLLDGLGAAKLALDKFEKLS